MSDDLPPGLRDAARARALAVHPPALVRDLVDAAVLRWQEEGLDDTVIGLIRVERGEASCFVERVVWAFDEEELRWKVDGRDLWELPHEVALALAERMQAELRGR